MVVWSLTSHDGLVDSLAVSIRDVGQGGNLEIQTNTVDMFVVREDKRATFQAGSINYWSCLQQRGTCQQSAKEC